MAGMLERDEWRAFSDAMALVAAGVLSLVGLILAVAGKDAVMAFHGCVLLGAAGLAFLYILTQMIERAEPRAEAGYADGRDPRRSDRHRPLGLGRLPGRRSHRLAARLPGAQSRFALDSSFGRLRPVHTSAVIFAFGGNALIATSFYVVQRTGPSRGSPAGWSAWFVFWGYQLFIVLAATGYLLGVTQSKEYAEPEWYVDLWLTAVWVVYFLVFFATLARGASRTSTWGTGSTSPSSSPSPCCTSSTIWRCRCHCAAQELLVYSGVQDALIQWWYGHNAVASSSPRLPGHDVLLRAEGGRAAGLFLPAFDRPFLVADLPLYLGGAPSPALHLLTEWAQSLGMTFSLMLWMPSWGGMINGLMTLPAPGTRSGRIRSIRLWSSP